ncbi:hypothetical protein A361_01685 [Cytobacillus oceanisediminis 2691]|uniref:Uncharacterized protein n=2 Tax=Cytobacillus oceanisediminis TaxID=665099 RepID=A0A160M6B4_9BACI|nr:hypothetical protein A361_01685 [Cytobacillus oceanisediminis 2691]OHX45096.1 hypothetical protein BBV17_24020 [Cytobacillus oceanisediminis]
MDTLINKYQGKLIKGLSLFEFGNDLPAEFRRNNRFIMKMRMAGGMPWLRCLIRQKMNQINNTSLCNG